MSDTEHTLLPVLGYLGQTDKSVSVVNRNKQTEEAILRQIDNMFADPQLYDARWASIAKTHIEQGFMALNRAVFRPQRVKLEGDA